MTNLHSLKASSPDCIPVVFLKNCEPELSYILAKLFNKCLKESCFPDCCKVLFLSLKKLSFLSCNNTKSILLNSRTQHFNELCKFNVKIPTGMVVRNKCTNH